MKIVNKQMASQSSNTHFGMMSYDENGVAEVSEELFVMLKTIPGHERHPEDTTLWPLSEDAYADPSLIENAIAVGKPFSPEGIINIFERWDDDDRLKFLELLGQFTADNITAKDDEEKSEELFAPRKGGRPKKTEG